LVVIPESCEVEVSPKRSEVELLSGWSCVELPPLDGNPLEPEPRRSLPKTPLGRGTGIWLGAGAGGAEGVPLGVEDGAGVAVAVGAGGESGVEDGAGVAEGAAVGVGAGEEPGVEDGVGVAAGVAVGAGGGATTLFEMLVWQVTVPPPPLPEPLHWSTVTTTVDVVVEPGSTVHRTRSVPPPPLPDPLHCVTAAPVVLAGEGAHTVVGAVPPPSPEALHWSTVAGAGEAVPVTLFTTSTLHVTVPPPPFPDPLH
jgi:hypothetical protein